MFGLGATEMILVGLVALIVIGPKDLPQMFRTMGKFSARIRGMAREFSQAMDAAADDAGMSEIKKTFRDVSNPKAYGIDKLREATNLNPTPKSETRSAQKPGSETEKLSKERQDFKKKMDERADQIVKARREREQVATSGDSADLSATSEPAKGPEPADLIEDVDTTDTADQK